MIPVSCVGDLVLLSDRGSELPSPSQSFWLQYLRNLINHPEQTGPCRISCLTSSTAHPGWSKAPVLRDREVWGWPDEQCQEGSLSFQDELPGAMLRWSSSEPCPAGMGRWRWQEEELCWPCPAVLLTRHFP